MKLVIDISEHDYDWIRRWAKDGTQVPVYDTLARYIAEGKVLSEDKERKTGKWISDDPFHKNVTLENGQVSCSCHCSECGDWLSASDEYPCRGYYCPNCGAKMEVDE